MISKEMLSAYNMIVKKHFSFVTVVPDYRFSDEYGDSVSAIGVPDERRAEFAAFVLDELAASVEDMGFEFVGVMPYSWKEAMEAFPNTTKKIALNTFAEMVIGKSISENWENAPTVIQPEHNKSQDKCGKEQMPMLSNRYSEAESAKQPFSRHALASNRHYIVVDTSIEQRNNDNGDPLWRAA